MSDWLATHLGEHVAVAEATATLAGEIRAAGRLAYEVREVDLVEWDLAEGRRGAFEVSSMPAAPPPDSVDQGDLLRKRRSQRDTSP